MDNIEVALLSYISDMSFESERWDMGTYHTTPLYTELQFDTMELRVEMAVRADVRRTVDEESSPLSRRMREFKY